MDRALDRFEQAVGRTEQKIERRIEQRQITGDQRESLEEILAQVRSIGRQLSDLR